MHIKILKTFKKLGAPKKIKVFPVNLKILKEQKYDLVICEAWLGNSYHEKINEKTLKFCKESFLQHYLALWDGYICSS